MERITFLQKEIADLKNILISKEKELSELEKKYITPDVEGIESSVNFEPNLNNSTLFGNTLTKSAIERYSRQILLPEIGVAGQEKICGGSVLIVGLGGLGCPAAAYLAGAGVGEIGLVDYDTVALANIHRQILHEESDVHMSKVMSAVASLRKLNSHIKITPYNVQLTSTNAVDIVKKYRVVLDCTDNVPSRYLLGDVCVLAKVPLVSGSALKMEGQLSVYGYRAEKNPEETDPLLVGPCYRCVFQQPPPAEAVGSCSAQGVAGPVPGMIGCLQALEAIKILVGVTHDKLLVGRMLIFDGEDMTLKTVRLRARGAACAACARPERLPLPDYERHCRAAARDHKKEQVRLKSQRRREEKIKRMTGQSYFGFRCTSASREQRKKWIQDVPKSGRKMGPPCASEHCAKGALRSCSEVTEENRREIFSVFWNDLDWKGKKDYVKRLVDIVPPKRRRLVHKGEISRKGDSKIYHLYIKEHRLKVCRVMFLNTLGIKEAMVRCWLVDEHKPRHSKKPLKSLNVNAYIDSLPKFPPKCAICRATDETQYVRADGVTNERQLYNKYVGDVSAGGACAASRRTFSKVVGARRVRVFRPRGEGDVCDVVPEHNAEAAQLHALDGNLNGFDVNCYYGQNNNSPW